jgi:hypothetical protein
VFVSKLYTLASFLHVQSIVKVLGLVVGYEPSYGFMLVFKDNSFILVPAYEKLCKYFEVLLLSSVTCFQNFRTRSFVELQL